MIMITEERTGRVWPGLLCSCPSQLWEAGAGCLCASCRSLVVPFSFSHVHLTASALWGENWMLKRRVQTYQCAQACSLLSFVFARGKAWGEMIGTECPLPQCQGCLGMWDWKWIFMEGADCPGCWCREGSTGQAGVWDGNDSAGRGGSWPLLSKASIRKCSLEKGHLMAFA